MGSPFRTRPGACRARDDASGQPGQIAHTEGPSTFQLHRIRATVHVPSAALGFLAHAEICFGSTVKRRLRVVKSHSITRLPQVAWDGTRASFPSVNECSLKYV